MSPGTTPNLSITVRLFFGDDIAGPSVGRRLDAISRQIKQLGHDLRIVSETVALQARFQLAVTPSLSAAPSTPPLRSHPSVRRICRASGATRSSGNVASEGNH